MQILSFTSGGLEMSHWIMIMSFGKRNKKQTKVLLHVTYPDWDTMGWMLVGV